MTSTFVLDPLLATATSAIDRGWIPDAAIRWGIRLLCRQRLREQEAVSRGSDAAARRRFAESLRLGEVAPVPEKANEQHYELPTELFQLMLGPRMKYSCCWWDGHARSLAVAEEASLQLTAAHADIRNGMRILELGCGWGSLTLWLADRFPDSRIVGVSNSRRQRAYIERAAAERGLSNVSVVTADMNVFDTPHRFDRVVSVEMFEHMRNQPALLARLARWLVPDGQLFIHVFCHRRHAYFFESEGAHNWMGRHFFTGGLMPSAALLPSLPSPFAVERQWDWSGIHYARTAEAWLSNLDARRDEALTVLARAYGSSAGGVWLERWRVFLMACAELFGYSSGREWGVAHYRFVQRADAAREIL